MTKDWAVLSEDEKADFLSRLAAVTHQTLDPEKTTLTSRPVSFLPGYKLVTARLQPQLIMDDRQSPYELDKASRSCLLVNPHAKNVSNRLIPLLSTQEWIVDVNHHLEAKVTEENVVDYLKFHVHVCFDEPILFITSLSGIPWDAKCTETDKAEVYGAVGAVVQTITIERRHSLFFEDVFRFKIPAIIEGTLWRVEAQVSERGYVDVESRSQINSRAVYEMQAAHPYYPVKLNDYDYSAVVPAWRRFARLGYRVFDRSIFYLSRISQIIVFVFFFAALPNSDRPLEQEIVMLLQVLSPGALNVIVAIFDVLFAGTVLAFAVNAGKTIYGSVMARAAARGPGRLSAKWKRLQEWVRKQTDAELVHYLRILAFALSSVVLLSASWAFIVFWLQFRYSAIFRSYAFPSFRESYIYAFTHMTITFWSGSYYGPPFSEPTTFWGGFVPWLIGSTGGALILKVTRQYWKLAKGTSNR